MNSDKLRERVLMYLYREMSSEEEKAFRAELDRNPLLKSILEEEQKLEEVYPKGSGSKISDDLLWENRLLVRAALQQERKKERTAHNSPLSPNSIFRIQLIFHEIPVQKIMNFWKFNKL